MVVALRILLTVLVAAFFLPSFWNLASAWVFNADLRAASNFSPVGVIEFSLPEGRSKGTAFLISDCTVMTNFHVVFGPWYLTALRPPSNANTGTFTLTQVTLANGEHPSTKAIPVIWGDYTGPDRQFRQPANDWVMLALEECLGYRHGYLQPYDGVLNDDIPDGGGFTAVGYSAGRQMVDSNCSLRAGAGSGSGATMLHDCAALPGDSGAPIVRRGTSRVVAMISGFHAGSSRSCRSFNGVVNEPWTSQCSNAAVPLSVALIDQIEVANCAVRAQNLLLRLGYDAGPYGVIEHPLFAKAIRQVEVENGLVKSGALCSVVCAVLTMRTLEI
jgi:Trypsin-like peptidase domain